MSIHISVESIQGKQRKEIIEEIQHQAKKAALSAIKNVLEAGLEAEGEGQLGSPLKPTLQAWSRSRKGTQDDCA